MEAQVGCHYKDNPAAVPEMGNKGLEYKDRILALNLQRMYSLKPLHNVFDLIDVMFASGQDPSM